uniref:Protein kinase domain-containing protein n=1 Tax=Photinus pyralis TaxID=7054 RepID=A0A1Y1ML94_PHOPY
MVVGEPNINNIMGGIENTGTVRLHNHRKKLKQRFDIIKKLGQGTYGKVQLGINKETGQEVAIKTIKKSKIETEADLVRIRREIQIMSSVQHPNIIHIYEVFENREKMVLVMEYAAGGELYDYLSERKVLAEEEARRIFRQIATACYYCHKHKICHRDLKLENILLDENGNAKIADFGLSNVFDDQRLLSTFCGSPLYASPEIVKGTPYQGPEVDCWSLGVLLYTLVYGAMPFDGSNFKRLVRQISQGDYFEPKKPSRASPLIRDMLTVNPRNRANIEKICLHWWVNESYEECCLDISEELANQTPVRLDLLLSLAPPPPQLESEKLVVTGEGQDESNNAEAAIPTRSQSVGSLMELTNPAQRRIKDLLLDDVKVSPKRKLETAISTDQISLSKDDIKRKEKIIKENTIADITLHSGHKVEGDEQTPETQLIKSQTRTLSPEMDVSEEFVDPSTQGAACAELMEDAKKNMTEKNAEEVIDKENKDVETKEEKVEEKQSKIPAKRKPVKKKVLTDKNDNLSTKPEQAEAIKEQIKTESEEVQTVSKPVERRRSRIFETAEKFQNMISANESKAPVEKPKKIVIPGVSVGGYKKEFERKASLTSNNVGTPKKPVEQEAAPPKAAEPEVAKDETVVAPPEVVEKVTPSEEEILAEKERKIQIKNAVDIISSALEKDGTRKSKSRPCMVRKPPVPFGVGGRSASGSITTLPTPLSPPNTPLVLFGANEAILPSTHSSVPAQVVEESHAEIPEEEKTSLAEITLKSATLPRRKTTKAEIKLDYPSPKPATMGFKTEMAHHVEGHPKLTTQRSEVTFPVTPTVPNSHRSASCEPENKAKPRERIIPISFERDVPEERRESVTSPTVKPPVTRIFQTQRSTTSQRSNSLSRQSTQESDSEGNVSSGEPIRKSPREYIIPIAVEGGGYVTPRAGSLEPSDTSSTMTSKSKFSRTRRLNDREGSEDESPFAALHRHSSFGRDSDTEDSRRDIFRMHSLRSSRPRKANMEHNDSFSSGEDDDDDGFEILTAENLFSTLLSRVRGLTQRLNVDGRPGFPASRLLSSHFDNRGDNFWKLRTDPLSRYSTLRRPSREQSVDSSVPRNLGTPWRRSVSRDLASDIDNVFNNSLSSPTHTATLPRGAEDFMCQKINNLRFKFEQREP